MITILWIIKSIEKSKIDDKDYWESDWFIASLFTIAMVFIDMMLVILVQQFIDLI